MWSKLKKPLIALGSAWGIFLVLFLALPNLLTLSVFIVLNAALPFFFIFLVLFAGGFFKAVEGVGWIKLLWVAAGFLYLLVANKWAGDVLNDIFKIDPSLFPTTSKVLTVVFGPLSLYGSSIWGWSNALAVVTFSLLFTVVLPAALISPTLWQQFSGKKWFWVGLAFVMVAIWAPVNSMLGHKYPILIELLAIWGDFNDNHRCANLEPQQAQKVIFLKDGNVLALRADLTGGTEYVVLRCEYVRPAP